MKGRIFTVLLKLSISLILFYLAFQAFMFGGFSSSIIAGILFLIGAFHHVFWPSHEEFDNEITSN